MGRVTLVWEEIGEHAFDLERIAVPGGWLVRTAVNESVSICFYPDPQHLWECDG